jgi:hypothetical protein
VRCHPAPAATLAPVAAARRTTVFAKNITR